MSFDQFIKICICELHSSQFTEGFYAVGVLAKPDGPFDEAYARAPFKIIKP